jgi:diguanylate cyclase (GGDEF)-like protein
MVEMHSERATPVALLALLYAVSGACAVVGAAWPMNRATPVPLLWTLGGLGLGLGAGLWLLRRSVPPWAVHAGVALATVLVSALAWRSASAVGIVGLGPALMAVALYSAHFLPLDAARAHVAVLLVLSSAGAWAARPSGFLVPWVVLAVSVAVVTEAQGRYTGFLRTAAATDPLTGVANRRAWEAEADRHLAHAARTGEPLSFALLDLDRFKEVNDESGHSAGDALLRELTERWGRELRRADLLGRYGGDEFVLCLPDTDEEGARELLERLTQSHAFAWSAGTALARPGDSLDAVLARADADLYLQKRANRT